HRLFAPFRSPDFFFRLFSVLQRQPSAAAMPLIGLFWLVHLASSAFPEEPGPLNTIPAEVVRRYPVFLGRAHSSSVNQEPLHIQRVLQVNRTLYIGARDDLFRVELDNMVGDEMFYSKKPRGVINTM
ncbi:hypothetical protein QTP70_027435, partial [Hemibagrus guttatus]